LNVYKCSVYKCIGPVNCLFSRPWMSRQSLPRGALLGDHDRRRVGVRRSDGRHDRGVDDQLRVHGLEALRIIDASVMPAVRSTKTNAPTIMIAEKGAAMIKLSSQERLAA